MQMKSHRSMSILCEEVLENLRKATPCFMTVKANSRGVISQLFALSLGIFLFDDISINLILAQQNFEGLGQDTPVLAQRTPPWVHNLYKDTISFQHFVAANRMSLNPKPDSSNLHVTYIVSDIAGFTLTLGFFWRSCSYFNTKHVFYSSGQNFSSSSPHLDCPAHTKTARSTCWFLSCSRSITRCHPVACVRGAERVWESRFCQSESCTFFLLRWPLDILIYYSSPQRPRLRLTSVSTAWMRSN